jgi:hypothetical protein
MLRFGLINTWGVDAHTYGEMGGGRGDGWRRWMRPTGQASPPLAVLGRARQAGQARPPLPRARRSVSGVGGARTCQGAKARQGSPSTLAAAGPRAAGAGARRRAAGGGAGLGGWWSRERWSRPRCAAGAVLEAGGGDGCGNGRRTGAAASRGPVGVAGAPPGRWWLRGCCRRTPGVVVSCPENSAEEAAALFSLLLPHLLRTSLPTHRRVVTTNAHSYSYVLRHPSRRLRLYIAPTSLGIRSWHRRYGVARELSGCCRGAATVATGCGRHALHLRPRSHRQPAMPVGWLHDPGQLSRRALRTFSLERPSGRQALATELTCSAIGARVRASRRPQEHQQLEPHLCVGQLPYNHRQARSHHLAHPRPYPVEAPQVQPLWEVLQAAAGPQEARQDACRGLGHAAFARAVEQQPSPPQRGGVRQPEPGAS